MRAEALSAEAFGGLGRVVERPASTPDASGHGFAWWAETALLDDGAYALGFLDLQREELRTDWAERHAHSVEAIVPLTGACVVYAAPPDARPPDGLRAFVLRPGQAVVLDRDVWHGAPLAVDGPAQALVALRQGTGQRDVELVHFPPVPFEVN